HRPASGGGDLRDHGRRPAVRVRRHADRAAGGGGGQRAAALRPRALHAEPAVRRRRPADRARRAAARRRGGARGPGGRGRPARRRLPQGRPVRGRGPADGAGGAAARRRGGARGPGGRGRPARRRRLTPMPARTPSPQLPLALRYPPDQRLETFAGDRALPLQRRQFAGGGAGRTLLLVGPAGSGKTHLALAACAEAEAARLRAAYLPLATTPGRLREAVEAMHAFDLVALDGLEAVAGEPGDELALFDFHNRMHDAGRRLLYTARVA